MLLRQWFFGSNGLSFGGYSPSAEVNSPPDVVRSPSVSSGSSSVAGRSPVVAMLGLRLLFGGASKSDSLGCLYGSAVLMWVLGRPLVYEEVGGWGRETRGATNYRRFYSCLFPQPPVASAESTRASPTPSPLSAPPLHG